jgi:uncharacterized protein
MNQPKMAETAVGIICKTPLAGVSKTRLVPLLGGGEAAELAACFLRDVSASIEAVPEAARRRGYAVYAPKGTEAVLRPLLPDSFGLICRCDATLGVVLHGAMGELLAAGHDAVILVNGDSPSLPPVAIAAAIAAMRAPGDRVVLGPASDGGYYLIGLKQPHAALFHDIPWSTPQVLAATIERARSLGLDVSLLPVWYDVDDEATLRMLADELAGYALPFNHGGMVGGPAPATSAFFKARPWLILRAATTLVQGCVER